MSAVVEKLNEAALNNFYGKIEIEMKDGKIVRVASAHEVITQEQLHEMRLN